LVSIIKVLSEFLGVVIWPAVFVFLLMRFSLPIGDFFASLSELTFKGAGIEATAKRKQFDAAIAFGAAIATSNTTSNKFEAIVEESKALANIVADEVTPKALRRLAESTILWVDDRPENNVFERSALEALGLQFYLSTSTEDALAKTNLRSFDAIISDMGRPPDSRAGYTLLDELRRRGDQTPFIIYAGSNKPEHKAEALRHGALGSTNRKDELVQLVLSAISGRKSAEA
jgi:CheY-like chemotaxis protein